MRIFIEFDKGNTEIDCKGVSVNSQVRLLVVHNHNGTIDNFNMDKIRWFTVPSTEVSTNHPNINKSSIN